MKFDFYMLIYLNQQVLNLILLYLKIRGQIYRDTLKQI